MSSPTTSRDGFHESDPYETGHRRHSSPQGPPICVANTAEGGVTINDLKAMGFGCRAYVYSEINAGRLRATKRGRFTVVLARDLDAWIATLPTIRPRSAMAAE